MLALSLSLSSSSLLLRVLLRRAVVAVVLLLLALLFPVLVVGTAINIGLPSLSECFEIDFVDLDDAFLTEIGLLLDDLLGLLLPILAKWWGWIG